MEEKLPGGIPLTMVEKVVDYTCALGLVSLWTVPCRRSAAGDAAPGGDRTPTLREVPPAFRGTGESWVNRAGLA